MAVKKNVLVLGDGLYKELFKGWGYNISPTIDNDVNLICFTGGTDINPEIYGEKRIVETDYPDYNRDDIEEEIYREAHKRNIPCAGICRGAQLLNVLNGGKLFQHVNGHGTYHTMSTSIGMDIRVSSSHHQMMRMGEGGEMLGWSNNLSSVYKTADGLWEEEVEREPEVIYYKSTKSLCIQPHPEWMDDSSDFKNMCKFWIKELI